MHKLHFKKGIKTEDLLNGVEFDVDDEGQRSSDDDDLFYDERFEDFKDAHNESSIKASESNIPFAELKSMMTPVTEDGLVKKQILKHGTGVIIPEKALVIMHYDAFLDNEKQSFDSTRLRKKPHKFLLGQGNLVPGLELGIESMKKEEVARILISPHYGYGEMGCPPRIPPRAEILYVVEIVNFFDSKHAVEFEEMTADEQKKASFEKIVAVFRCEHELANEVFRQKQYRPAIARYRRMVKLLEDVSVSNEEEDVKRNGYLMKLYLNLCLCYINIRDSSKAIVYGKLAVKLDESHPNAMYRLGCAYLVQNDFDNAKEYLLKARQHKPFQSQVQKVLIDLEKKRKEYEQWENVFARRIFPSLAPEKEEKACSSEVKEFKKLIQEQLQKFVDSDEKELPFSPGYSDWQIDIVKELATVHDLAFVSKIHSGEKIVKVVKK